MTGLLKVLNVAYPFAPVGPQAIGGAEQVLTALDQLLSARGHLSWVVACAGSRTRGTLRSFAPPPGELDQPTQRRARARYAALIRDVVAEARPDLVHLHGVDFAEYLPDPPVPVLVTLHLPLSFYRREQLALERPNTLLCCVSRLQRELASPGLRFGPDLPNGVPIDKLRPRPDRGNYLLLLSRICAEKGVHVALEVAHRLELPLLIAGSVFPYPEHERYFRERVEPLLDHQRRYIGPVDLPRKAELLARARCLLVPSLVDETSSLVSMEALACGTPVVAFRRGALPDTIEHAATGFVVDSLDEMVAAVADVGRLDPRRCRAAAERRFSQRAMVDRYEVAYRRLLAVSGQLTPRTREHAERESY